MARRWPFSTAIRKPIAPAPPPSRSLPSLDQLTKGAGAEVGQRRILVQHGHVFDQGLRSGRLIEV